MNSRRASKCSFRPNTDVSYAIFLNRCRDCVDAIDAERVGARCGQDGGKCTDHARAGQCPRDFYKAALLEQQLLQQGYGPADPRFPGKGGCGC